MAEEGPNRRSGMGCAMRRASPLTRFPGGSRVTFGVNRGGLEFNKD